MNQLRIEWSLNEQYHYGWAVPVLAGYLLWRNKQRGAGGEGLSDIGCQLPDGGEERLKAEGSRLRTSGEGSAAASLHPGNFAFRISTFALLWLLLPLRLIQEANSDWRMVSWGLALTIVGLLWLGVWRWGGWPALRASAFPICFLLVSVPWPSGLEQWLVQNLAGLNTATAVEILGWAGFPAVARGNLIELPTGVVEIDGACSGIRSLQAIVMASLFFGEFYRHTWKVRLKLLGWGVALALGCNVARTGFLVWIAASRGLTVMQAWHDPAGVAILLLSLTGLWMMGSAERGAGGERLKAEGSRLKTRGGGEEFARFRISNFGFRTSTAFAALAWFGVVELATFGWYYAHEQGRPAPVVWRFEMPKQRATFRELAISPETQRMLRFDKGVHATWREPDGATIESYFFEWQPGRSSATLARNHTPEVCLPAAGRKILSQEDVTVPVEGLELPFRHFVLSVGDQVAHVFYCLWEDRSLTQSAEVKFPDFQNRLQAVWEGRRNMGQRVLHVGMRGLNSTGDAVAALRRILASGVKGS